MPRSVAVRSGWRTGPWLENPPLEFAGWKAGGEAPGLAFSGALSSVSTGGKRTGAFRSPLGSSADGANFGAGDSKFGAADSSLGAANGFLEEGFETKLSTGLRSA